MHALLTTSSLPASSSPCGAASAGATAAAATPRSFRASMSIVPWVYWPPFFFAHPGHSKLLRLLSPSWYICYWQDWGWQCKAAREERLSVFGNGKTIVPIGCVQRIVSHLKVDAAPVEPLVAIVALNHERAVVWASAKAVPVAPVV